MRGHEHLSEDSLLNAVYGIAEDGANVHLRECADCAQRLNEWHEKRTAAVAMSKSRRVPGCAAQKNL